MRNARILALTGAMWWGTMACPGGVVPWPAMADEPQSAVVVVYHRFGEDAYPSTSVTIEQFEQHLAILDEGGYRVLPLEEIVEGLAGERELPDRTVAITVDDTYRSILTEAMPRFLDRGFPSPSSSTPTR